MKKQYYALASVIAIASQTLCVSDPSNMSNMQIKDLNKTVILHREMGSNTELQEDSHNLTAGCSDHTTFKKESVPSCADSKEGTAPENTAELSKQVV